MDFQAFVNSVAVPCAVLSVEKKPGGDWGEIRIVTANEPYRQTMGPRYYDNMIYSELVPKDLKFEDYCYRAAVLGRRMHAYVETRALNCWTDQQMIPLESDREDIGYCQYLFEFTQNAEADRMSSVCAESASALIKCSLSLMTTENISESLKAVVSEIMEVSGAATSRIMLIDDDTQTVTNLCEMFAPGEPVNSAAISYEIVKTWEAMIGVSNGVIVKNEHEMDDLERRNPAWVRSMRAYGVTSLAMVPMRREKRVIGYLYVINFNVEKVIEVKELLEVLSFIVGAEISNHSLMARLDALSKRDELTGVMNRNAFKRQIAELEQSCCMPLGVVYMDVNGLKRINDQEGHESGDTLLRHAAQMMERAFEHDHLYRAGGDEFVAIMENCNKMEFDRRVAHFRQLEVSAPTINIAVGAYWTDDAAENVRSIFQKADSEMYADKRAFYLRHPEMNRRKR
ncbi:MAG: sensor domain-containing diguanylate cyclase [Clostridia bacterium]|nr:sensor domain-containing diguanylate cyclase [Clostridia bacterium]